jgi:hypothetical protein
LNTPEGFKELHLNFVGGAKCDFIAPGGVPTAEPVPACPVFFGGGLPREDGGLSQMPMSSYSFNDTKYTIDLIFLMFLCR